MAETDIKKMKVTDLREALEKRGLSTEGLKADLVNRLQARLDEEEFGLVEAPPAGSPGKDDTPAADAAAPAEKKQAELSVVESSEPLKEEAAAVAAAEAPAVPVEETKKDDIDAAAKTEDSKTKSAASPKETAPKVTAEMSFKERMEQRAKRFGIQPNEKTKKDMRTQRFGTGDKGGSAKKQQQQMGGNKGKGVGQKNGSKKQQQQQKQQTGNKRRESGGGKEGSKKQDQKKQKVEESPLLPKDEIEKRLARAAKYKTSEGVDELKAMLRRHRFST